MVEDAEVSSIGSRDCEDETVKRSLLTSKNLKEATSYLTPKARLAFTQLRKAFTKAPILQYFDLECHIRIEIDASGYAIDSLLSQLTNLGQWHLLAYYSQKKILAKTQYKTHNDELLAILKVFKTWQNCLEGYKHEVLVLTNDNHLRRFMETKTLNSCHVWWAQELSRYHFQINYYQAYLNGAANAPSHFFKRNKDEEEKVWAENTWILHCLQPSLTNTTLAGLSMSASLNLLPAHQILICGTYGLSQLRQFWDIFRSELANKGPYKVNISSMRLRLQEL